MLKPYFQDVFTSADRGGSNYACRETGGLIKKIGAPIRRRWRAIGLEWGLHGGGVGMRLNELVSSNGLFLRESPQMAAVTKS